MIHAFDLIIFYLTVSLFVEVFELYLEFLKRKLHFYCCVFLTELSNSPIFFSIFLDDTVDRSLFFMDGIDPTHKSNRSIKTGLTFVLCIFFEIPENMM
jgi:hypothetical protein